MSHIEAGSITPSCNTSFVGVQRVLLDRARVVLPAPLDVARNIRRTRTQVRRRRRFIDLGFKRSDLFDQESRKLGVAGRLRELEKRLCLTREVTPTGHSTFSYDLPS
jgi:hypothetical protein